jgi:hypothetical protein
MCLTYIEPQPLQRSGQWRNASFFVTAKCDNEPGGRLRQKLGYYPIVTYELIKFMSCLTVVWIRDHPGPSLTFERRFGDPFGLRSRNGFGVATDAGRYFECRCVLGVPVMSVTRSFRFHD